MSNGVPQSKSLPVNFLLLGDDLFESTIPNRQWSSLFCEVRRFVVTFGGCAMFVCLATISQARCVHIGEGAFQELSFVGPWVDVGEETTHQREIVPRI